MNDSEEKFGKKKKIYTVAISLFILLFISAAIWPSQLMFAVVIGVYLLATFATFIFFVEEYYVSMITYRKGFYLTFFGVVGIAIANNVIGISDWQILLQLVAAAIFLDLALFQTPAISKIWNAEFDRDAYTLRTIEEHKQIVNINNAKSLIFHKVIANSSSDVLTVPTQSNWEEHKELLLKYLSRYAGKLNLDVLLIELVWDDVYFEYNNFEETIHHMVGYHGIESPSEEQLETWKSILEIGDYVLIENTLSDVVIMSFFGEKYSFLLSVVGKGSVEANQVDAMYLINMANIIEWHTS